MNRLSTTLVLLCVLAKPLFAHQPSTVTTEFVFTKASFPQCHASTLEETKNGVLVAAWFGGTREKHKDVGIWVARRLGASAAGEGAEGAWTKPAEAANGVQYVDFNGEEHRHPCWNPVLHQTPDGPLQLYYKCGPSPSQWWGMLTESSDDGRTWSQPRRLPESIDGPVKNKPIRLADGSLLCGSSTEYDGWRVHMERTTDHGVTWLRSQPLNDGKAISAIQPSILQHGNGVLQAIGRSRQQHVWDMWSKDHGKSWGPMKLTELPNPNAGTDAVTLSDGRHVLVYNHTKRGRTPLNVAYSEDGKQWFAANVLESEPGEYSYPAVIQTKDGHLHITYTWRRQRIRHVEIDPDSLKGSAIRNGVWP